jgi:hypothetical protein
MKKVNPRSALVLLLLLFALCLVDCICVSAASSQEQNANQNTAALPKNADSIVATLTPHARELADLASITTLLNDLDEAQRNCALAQKTAAGSVEDLTRKQRLLYIRTKLNTFVQATNLQINSTKGILDSAIAQADDLKAFLTEQRNRVTHRNSQINLVSGGVTKMVGYGIALADLSAIPTNVLEVFDGGVQSGLSSLALREERREGKLEHGMPVILQAFLDGKPDPHFPWLIWRYMNDSPAGEGTLKGQSRRQIMIANWQKTGITTRATGMPKKQTGKVMVTVDLLDQRMAMLSDVNSLVSKMHAALMSLSDAVSASYTRDPEF